MSEKPQINPPRIGSLQLKNPFLQASLSGYSDWAMRKLAAEFGASFTYLGVVLAKSAAHKKAIKAFAPHNDEDCIGAQVMGRDPKVMAEGAVNLEKIGYQTIDLNYGCPAPKVLRRKRGGYVLNEPDLAIEIYKRVREAVSCPVTMKLRIGYDKSNESLDNFWEIATRAADEGVDALIVHPRRTLQRFRGEPDYHVLKELKQKCPKTTILGSGNLFKAENIMQIMEETGIDGVTIARGAVGNPWVFRDLTALYANQPLPEPPTLKEQGEVILHHFEMTATLYRGQKSVRYFRKFIAQYTRRHPERKKVRLAIMDIHDHNKLIDAIRFWYGC